MEHKEEPSEAERHAAVADAGMGANDAIATPGGHESQKAADGPANSDHSNLSTSSDLEAPQEKDEVKDEPTPRSSLKTGLIMASLCVGTPPVLPKAGIMELMWR